MAQHKVIDLINQFMEDHGQSSGKDRVMLWLEDVYSKVRRLPWSWNFKVTQTQTGGGGLSTDAIEVTADTETFYWTQGHDYIRSTHDTGHVASVVDRATGRFVYIGNEWYQCTRIAPTGDLDKIYLNKKIVAPSASGQTVSFHRRNLSFMTNGIKSLHVDDRKLENITEEQIYRFKRGIDPRWYYGDSGSPLGYHADKGQIKAPEHAPYYVFTDGVEGPTPGTHVSFFTFYDQETGQESPPGPSTEFTTTSTTRYVTLYYGEIDGYHSDETTYERRVYVTQKKDKYTRMPAFKIQEVTAYSGAGANFESADLVLGAFDRYYDGPWTNVVFYPAPDEYKRAEALHIDSWAGLPGESDNIKLGRQREFVELFHLYFLMKQSLQNKDPAQFRQMQAAFREQLNFLLGQDGDDQRLDPSSWEYRFFSPAQSVVHGDDFTSSLKYPF